MSEYTIAQKSSVYGVVCFLVFIGCGLDWEEGTNARTKVFADTKNRAPLAREGADRLNAELQQHLPNLFRRVVELMIERENDRLPVFDQLHFCPRWKRGSGLVKAHLYFDYVVHSMY